MTGAFLGVAGAIGTGILFIVALARPRKFLLSLLAIKPFVDITVNAGLGVGGGVRINALAASGVLVLVVAGVMYLSGNLRGIFNHGLIWAFLTLNVARGLIAVAEGEASVLRFLEVGIRLFDAYLLYFIARDFLFRQAPIARIARVLWFSTLGVGLITIGAYLSGSYNVDISRGVVRVGGLYNDPGTPAYMSVFSILFATMYVEVTRRGRISLQRLDRVFLALTFFSLIFIMTITLTKSAMLMLLVFVTLWWGIFRRRFVLVAPAVALAAWLAFSHSDAFRTRFQEEAQLFQSGELSFSNAQEVSLGMGRVNRWARILEIYRHDLSPVEKLFGVYEAYNAHNQYLAYLMELGIVGLGLFCAILIRFAAALLRLYRLSRRPEVGLTFVLLCMLAVYAVTGHPFYYTTILWYLTIMLGLINFWRDEFRVQGDARGGFQPTRRPRGAQASMLPTAGPA